MRHFEDFKPGEVTDLGSCTVTEDEILAYAWRYDPQPFHTDPDAARRSIYGGLIASGWHTCALMMRLSVEANERVRAAAMGSPGIDSCRWLKPVRAGDTLTGTTEVLETWPSRSRAMGFVRRRVDMINQRGESALTLVGISIYARRDGQKPEVPHHPAPAEEVAPRGAEDSAPAEVEPIATTRPLPADGRLYFEDVQVGDRMRFGRYAVTKEEVVEFARRFDPQPFHLDEAGARQSLFGGLIASGWHTGAMFIRMVCDHMVPRVVTSGALGFDDLKWLKPVRPGDVLSVESVIQDKVPSRSRSDRGTVKIASRVMNQSGEAAMSLVSLVIYHRRAAS